MRLGEIFEQQHEGTKPMGLPKPRPWCTVDEYLAIERGSEERYTFLDGEIYAMAGESGKHADISTNLVGSLVNQLKGKPCRARCKDTKVRSGSTPESGKSKVGMYSYPDV